MSVATIFNKGECGAVGAIQLLIAYWVFAETTGLTTRRPEDLMRTDHDAADNSYTLGKQFKWRTNPL